MFDYSHSKKKFLIGNSLTEHKKEELISFLRDKHDASLGIYMIYWHWPQGGEPLTSCGSNIPADHTEGTMDNPRYVKSSGTGIGKRLKERSIKEVQLSKFLSKLVIVRKSNRKWRVCIYFNDLKKACPKDNFPLLKTDQLVDATSSQEWMLFLDAYSSNHNIPLFDID